MIASVLGKVVIGIGVLVGLVILACKLTPMILNAYRAWKRRKA